MFSVVISIFAVIDNCHIYITVIKDCVIYTIARNFYSLIVNF